MKNVLLVVVLCAVIMCASASYAVNFLDNGSFENPVLDAGIMTYENVTGWSGSFYHANGNLWGLSPQDGSQFVFFHANASFNWTNHIVQPNLIYTIKYFIGRDSDINDTSEYQVEMFGQTYQNDMTAAGYAPMTFDNSSLVLNPGEWKQNTMTFETGESGGPIGKYLTVWIQSSSALPNNYVAFDGIEVSTTPNLLDNGSFEDPVVASGSFGPMTGWSNNFYRANGSLWGLLPQDGSQFVYLSSNTCFNWTTNVIEPLTTYTLTYSIGRTSDPCEYQVELFGVSEINNPGVPGYTPMALDNSTLVLNQYEWKQNSISFTTGESGGPIGKYLTVWILSKAGSYVAFDKMQLTATPLPPPGFSLTGKVNLLDFGGDKTTIPVTVEVGATTYTPALDAEGNFTILDVPSGTYDVRIKASHWLANMTSGVVIAADTVMDPVSLINGDVVENNEVDFSDINAVRAAYGSFPGDETWNDRADVDGSGEVDFTDINIVRSNYGEIGG